MLHARRVAVKHDGMQQVVQHLCSCLAERGTDPAAWEK